MGDESIWKKEISFSRKPKEKEPEAETTEESVQPEAAAEPSVVERVISFTPKRDPEPVSEEPVAEEPVAEEPVADEQVQGTVPEPGHQETAETPAVEHVTFTPKREVELVAEEPVAEEPIADEPAPAVETWSAAPALPPAPEPQPVAVSEPEPVAVLEPAPGVHLPVPAAEPQPLEEETKSVPFWKKEISLGGGKKTPKAPKQSAPADSKDTEEKNVPFWKRDLSLGGNKEPKAPKQPKERKQAEPKAEREPKKKQPKQPKPPKAPRVKVDRGGGGKRITGLKIGASQLAAARVSNNGTAELLQVARESLPSGIVVGGELRDPDALSDALKEFFNKNGLPKKGVRLGIANNRIGVRTFDVAGIDDPKQLANAIRFRAQEALPIPIDEAVLDYQVIGEGTDEAGNATKRVLLVVAYRELIDRYVDACKKAGIVLAGIDLEAFALLRALAAPQDGVGSDPSAALVAVAIGHERSTFAVSDGRVCEFTRVLEWGGAALNVAIARVLDAAPSEVEGAKRALALTDEMVPDGLNADQAKRAREAMRRAIQTFARELVSSLQYYQNQPGSLGIAEIVLTGGTAHLPGLSGELERLIGVRVRVGDPLARMKVSKKIGEPEQIGSLAVAIGLGIED
jgi:type IV pilus assembly protein PilM